MTATAQPTDMRLVPTRDGASLEGAVVHLDGRGGVRLEADPPCAYAFQASTTEITITARVPIWERVRATLDEQQQAVDAAMGLAEHPDYRELGPDGAAFVIELVMADYAEFGTGEDVETYARAWARGYFRS